MYAHREYIENTTRTHTSYSLAAVQQRSPPCSEVNTTVDLGSMAVVARTVGDLSPARLQDILRQSLASSDLKVSSRPD